MSKLGRVALLALVAGGLSGCFAMLPTKGGAFTEWSGPRRFNPADVRL
jgi:hypothetical protein